jgi:hypothetical protein
MFDKFLGRIPENLIIMCTFLAWLVPFLFYKSNQKLHKYGDPPWKNEIDENSDQ